MFIHILSGFSKPCALSLAECNRNVGYFSVMLPAMIAGKFSLDFSVERPGSVLCSALLSLIRQKTSCLSFVCNSDTTNMFAQLWSFFYWEKSGFHCHSKMRSFHRVCCGVKVILLKHLVSLILSTPNPWLSLNCNVLERIKVEILKAFLLLFLPYLQELKLDFQKIVLSFTFPISIGIMCE